MENKSNKKSSIKVCKDITEILGTRYYRVAILTTKEEETLCIVTAYLQTPLSPEELQQFVANRIGKEYTVIATRISKADVSCGEIIPLVNLEALLKPYVPEIVQEVTYAKIVRTTKGTTVQVPIDPETGEIIKR